MGTCCCWTNFGKIIGVCFWNFSDQPMVRSEKFQKQTPIILPKLVQQQQVRPSTTLRACTHATPCVHGSITPQPMVQSEKFQKQTPIIILKLFSQYYDRIDEIS